MRKLAIFAGAFACGIALSQYLLPWEQQLTAAAVCLLLACGAMLLPGKKWYKRLLLAGVGASLAFGWNWLYVRQAVLPVSDLGEAAIPVVMTVCDYPEPTDYGVRVTVRIRGIPVGKTAYYADGALLSLRPGQTVQDEVTLRSTVTEQLTSAFASKGVFTLAVSKGMPAAELGSANAFRWYPVRLGHAMRERIDTLYEGDDAAVLCAMLTGDRSGLSDEVLAAFSETGLRHVLAVSGMHCMFLLEMVTLATGFHRKRMLAACAVPLLVFYALLTGGSPSIARACCMAVCSLAAPLFRRDSDGPTSLCTALLLILTANPFAVQSVSFQLSFGAMAGILWLSMPLYRLLVGERTPNAAVRYAAGSVSVSISALVFTAPLSLWYFGMLSLLSPLSNLLCLWAVSWSFLLGLVSVAVSAVWMPLGVLASYPTKLLLSYFLGMTHLLTRLPHAGLYRPNLYAMAALAVGYLLFGIARLGKGDRRTYGTAAVLTVAVLACSTQLWYARYRDGRLHLLALDVGQGQSVLLSSDSRFALLDCGSGNSWITAGDAAVSYLKSMGCSSLDVLAVTHYDADHVNGIVTVLARMPVETLLVPDWEEDNALRREILNTAERYGVPVQTVTEAVSGSLGSSVLTVYPSGESSSGNDSGLAFLWSRGESEVLVTGDMDAAGERRLLDTYDLPEVEVLFAGHHGSKTSTSESLLNAVQPELAIASVGENSYGHPSPEALRRLRKVGADIYRTDLQGTIAVCMK